MLQAFLGFGQYFHEDGFRNHSWWSIFTTTNYQASKQCIEFYLKHKTNLHATAQEINDLLWSGAALHVAHKAFGIFLGQYAEWLQQISPSKTAYTQSQLFFFGFVLATHAISASLFIHITFSSTISKKLPNIVFILADDMGWGDVSFHGSTQIPTPNIDALASTGVVLNNYYTMPLCSPSRGALLSGLYCIHTGFQHYALLPAQPAGLPLDLKIMPEYFKDLGYETRILGKWHLGYFSEKYMPTNRGFDSFCGMHTGPNDYYSHVLKWDDHEGLDFWENTEPLATKNGTYSTTLFTEQAKSIIANRDKSKPLFLYLAHQATHGGVDPNPLQAPEENVDKFPYIGDPDRTRYAGMVDALDKSVGAVLEALEAASMLENTIIVFSSDNGAFPKGPLSNHGTNWPLRGAKGTLWEGGMRVPAFLWTAQILPHRRVSQQLMHITDWLPTLYSAAGGDVSRLGSVDGIDMWKVLNTGKPSPRTEILLNIDPVASTAALRYQNYKLVLGNFGQVDQRFEIPGSDRPCDDLDDLLRQSSAAAVLSRLYGKQPVFKQVARWRRQATVTCGDSSKTNFAFNTTYHLFDIAQDPCELQNLADENPALLSMLLQKLTIYNETAVPPVNDTIDPRGYPENNGGIWATWL
ncbi:arylsulfatase B-like [Amblyomma americanum]